MSNEIAKLLKGLKVARAQAVALAEQTDELINRIESGETEPSGAVTLLEAAKLIGAHKNTVRNLVADGKLVPIKNGSRIVRVTRKSVEDYLEGRSESK